MNIEFEYRISNFEFSLKRVLIERKSSFLVTNTMLLLRLTEGGDREGRMEESSHLRQVTSPETGHQAPAGNSFLLTLTFCSLLLQLALAEYS